MAATTLRHGQHDATCAGLRGEPRAPTLHPDASEEASHEREVHPAHEQPRFVREHLERAVTQPHLPIHARRLETAITEDGQQVRASGASRVGAKLPPPVAGGSLERAARGGGRRVGERASEHPPGELIAALRKRDVELSRRAAVQLRRAARARPATAGQPAVGSLEEPLVDQLVEVKCRQGARDAERAGSFVTTHVATPPRHVDI